MMPMPLLSLLGIVFLGILGAVGDVFIKRAASSGTPVDLRYFALGLAVYLIAGTGWFFVMRSAKLVTLGPVYAVTTALLLVVSGVLFFGEKVHVLELVGIVLAILAIVLLSRFAEA